MKKLHQMTKMELIFEANRLGLRTDKNITRAALLSEVSKWMKGEVVPTEQDDAAASAEKDSQLPVIDVPQSALLAGTYVLLCDAMVNGGRHMMGERVELDEENAKLLLAQGAITIG